MARRVQASLPGIETTVRKVHGGDTRVGRRKEARPLAVKRAMHLVLRAEAATGEWSLRRKGHAAFVKSEMLRRGRQFGVRVFNFSINRNHLHLLVQARDRQGMQSFLRVFSGRVAQFITGARKGNALKQRFWNQPVFSRIVEWGRDFVAAKTYVCQNALESAGALPYLPPKARRQIKHASRSALWRRPPPGSGEITR